MSFYASNIQSELIDQNGRLKIAIPPELINPFGQFVVAENRNQIVLSLGRTWPLINTEGEISGSGTGSTFNFGDGYLDLSVGTSQGKRIWRSQRACHSVPGDSLVYASTFSFVEVVSGVVKQVGLFAPDFNKGVYLELDGTDLYFVIQSDGLGTIRVHQSEWNYDKFDSNSPTFEFDVAKINAVVFASARVGLCDLYCGFFYNGAIRIAHVFSVLGQYSIPYIGTGNLFPCSVIEQTETSGTSSISRVVCGTLISQGATAPKEYPLSVMLQSERVCENKNNVYALIAVRLNPSYLGGNVQIRKRSVLVTSGGDDCRLLLIRNPVISNYTYNWTDMGNTSWQYDNNISDDATLSYSNSDLNYVDIFSTSNHSTTSGETTAGETELFLGSFFDNTPTVFVLAFQSTNNNVLVTDAALELIEVY